MTRLTINRKTEPAPRHPAVSDEFLPHVARLLLEHIPVRAYRMKLDTGRVEANIPMLRGVWGKAIRELCPELYREIFDVESSSGSVAASPPYIVRVASPDPEWIPAIEWILVGNGVEHAEELLRCWHYAATCGLGREREPMEIERLEAILPDESTTREAATWPLSQPAWPLPPDAPCRLVFPVPLRLRYRGRLVESPTLCDIVASLNRRIAGFLPADDRSLWLALGKQFMECARGTLQERWAGERLDLVRYSGRQKREVDVHGVVGSLTLPRGAGLLAPLLAAARWIHVGKHTVMGLGQLLVEPLE